MKLVTTKSKLIGLLISVGLLIPPVFANEITVNSTATPNSFFSRFSPKNAHILFQAGGFSASQGNVQNVDIEGLIGDYYTVNQGYDQNLLIGLGYYIDGFEKANVNFLYGLNAFYFFHTVVSGDIIQEQLFTNLSYSYSLTNYPLYFAVRALVRPNSDRFDITFDLGVGPNFIQTSNYSENSLDGITIPDNAFSGQTNVVLSATAGIGVKINNVFGRVPLEVGYKFFYLGQGSLNKTNNQITNTLNTGNNFANALLFTIAV